MSAQCPMPSGRLALPAQCRHSGALVTRRALTHHSSLVPRPWRRTALEATSRSSDAVALTPGDQVSQPMTLRGGGLVIAWTGGVLVAGICLVVHVMSLPRALELHRR